MRMAFGGGAWWLVAGTLLAANVRAQTPAEAAAEAGERANVRRIYDRITARQISLRKISARQKEPEKPAPYKVTIPFTTVSYDMVPIPAGEFLMGSPETDPQHKKEELPQHKARVDAFWMQAHEVTWDEYLLFMFAKQAAETEHKDESVDALSRPTRPYVEMSFGMGINGFPAISM